MTVEKLEREMSGVELDEWMEFYTLEPFGNDEKMNDARHGALCSMIANAVGTAMKPIDFMMYKNTEEKEESTEGWESKLLKAMTTI